MFNKQLVRDHYGQYYKIQTNRDKNAPHALKPEQFYSASQAYRFINNLVVSPDYWKSIYNTQPQFNTTARNEIELRGNIAELLARGTLKAYKVELPSSTDKPPEKRTLINSRKDKHIFVHASSLLNSNPKEVLFFDSKDKAAEFLSELAPDTSALQKLVDELGLSKKQGNDSTELVNVISQSLSSGEIKVIVDRYSSPVFSGANLSSPGQTDRQAGLGPSPTQNDNKLNSLQKNLSDASAISGLSPTLTNNIKQLRKQGWKFKIGKAGGGSYASKDEKTITIDFNETKNPAGYVQTLAHETGHALYTADPYVPPTGLSKEEYIDANVKPNLKDEGEATLMNIQVRDEILSKNGPDIGIAGTQGEAYEKSYKDFKKHGDRDKAREDIGNIFADNERPSTAPDKTYKQYYAEHYEDYWNKNNK